MTSRRQTALVMLTLAVTALLVSALGLPGAARLLVVADALTSADALYVFPGGVPERAACAADLFADGIAPQVVLSGERVQPELDALGIALTDADVNARILSRRGVPGPALVVLREGTSTWEDAQALRRWALDRPGINRVIAVTSPHHSRRARRALQRTFHDTGVDVRVWPCPSRMASDWWRHEETLLQVVDEYVKLAYYALVY
jgi:uncharacterized SAM-binding protein YcdF (DUF218 family)